MKKLLLAVFLLITLPALAAEPNVKLIVSKIGLTPLKNLLKLKDKTLFESTITQYWFDFSIDEKTETSYGYFEIKGKNSNDADKITIVCRRFGADGNGEKQENSISPCGKVFEKSLALIVDRPSALISYLMNETKQQALEYSPKFKAGVSQKEMAEHMRLSSKYASSKIQIQDFVFKYVNDGALSVHRASRITQ